jgi:hypothetical protein
VGEQIFKNSNGQWLTKSLFKEFNPESDLTIQRLKELYLDANDLTEYSFATRCLGGWQHWKVLCEAYFFKPEVEKWREELELKIRAEALAKIIVTSKGDNKDAFIATRYLADRGWRESATKGRPSKAEVKKQALALAEAGERVAADYNRISEFIQ